MTASGSVYRASAGEVWFDEGDPTVAFVDSHSEAGKRYRVTHVDSLYPKCNCMAGQNGKDCKHVEAVMEAVTARLRKEHGMAHGPSIKDWRDEEAAEKAGESQALVLHRPSASLAVGQRAANVRQSLAAVRGGYEDAKYIAEHVIGRAMWPQELQDDKEDGANKAALIVMTAAELGVSPIQAFSYITAIKGKPFVMARMVDALINSRIPGAYIHITERTSSAVTGVAQRPGRPDTTITITMEDANKAGWSVNRWKDRESNQMREKIKETWAAMPANMLTARVKTTLGWMVFADVLAGMDVYDTDTGEAMYVAEVESVPGTVTAAAGKPVARATISHDGFRTFNDKNEQTSYIPATPMQDVADADYSEMPPEEDVPDEEPPYDPAPQSDLFPAGEAMTELEYKDRCQQQFGSWGVDLKRNITWGSVKAAFGIASSKPSEIVHEAFLAVAGEDDPIAATYERVAANPPK